MNKRTAWVMLMLGCLGLAGTANIAHATAPAPRPNILFIVMDDARCRYIARRSSAQGLCPGSRHTDSPAAFKPNRTAAFPHRFLSLPANFSANFPHESAAWGYKSSCRV